MLYYLLPSGIVSVPYNRNNGTKLYAQHARMQLHPWGFTAYSVQPDIMDIRSRTAAGNRKSKKGFLRFGTAKRNFLRAFFLTSVL